MQKIYFWIYVALFIGNIQVCHAQTSDLPAAAFDVIVLKNGTIVHGKVMEVGMSLIRYKRTDIPDGPIYELYKNEVYAISYRNQLTEYMEPQDSTKFGQKEIPSVKDSIAMPVSGYTSDFPERNWYSSVQSGEVRVGFGLIRNYSRVKEVDEYKNELSFPSVHISYMFPVNHSIHIGLAMDFAGFKYADKSFSEYDQLMTDRMINENLFSIAVIGKYGFDMELIRPYFLTGVSFTNSSVKTKGTVTFTDDERTIMIHGGARSGHFRIPLRAGVDVRITDAFNTFIEVGTGFSVLQLGGVIKIGR